MTRNYAFKNDLQKRVYTLNVSLLCFLDRQPRELISKNIVDQLIRSSTSILANYTEAQAASSTKDFINFLHHALKSANESEIWLQLLYDIRGKKDFDNIPSYIREVKEIANILAASIVTIKRKGLKH